jgi:hypothetical protein
MKKMNNAINWFDIPVLDMNRAMNFYGAILEIELHLMEFPNGLKIASFPVEDGTIGGALSYHPEHYIPAKTGSLVYLNANPDLQTVLNKVEPNGGKVLMPKSLISEHWGNMSLIEDTEGNRVALHSNN